VLKTRGCGCIRLITPRFFFTTVNLSLRTILGYGVCAVRCCSARWACWEAPGLRVAFWAHVGGFVAGLVLIKLFSRCRFLGSASAGMFHLGARVSVGV